MKEPNARYICAAFEKMKESDPSLNFNDTEIAFRYKDDKEMRRALFIFSVVNHPWISALGISLVRLAIFLKLPVTAILRNTVFRHFCGGETIDESRTLISKLGAFQVQTILDYAVEGEKSERGFDTTCSEVLKTFDEAVLSKNVPFCVFKVTGMADMTLLEKIQAGATLTEDESNAYARVNSRIRTICEKSAQTGIPVMIDAEETWIQDPIDALALAMMKEFNRTKALVYFTCQMYRRDMPERLKRSMETAKQEGFILGVKMVRGAYMEKERERATTKGYPDPIWPDKTSTDKAFNDGLRFCVENSGHIRLVCGSHNEESNRLLADLMTSKAESVNGVWFSQLLGMSDHISFNLAKSGYQVVKYVPFGPVLSVVPYLLRRAEENTSVAGQSSRELLLIRKEVNRRKRSS